MGIRLAGGDKHGLFICEVQSNSVAQKAGLLVADKIFSVSSSLILLNEKSKLNNTWMICYINDSIVLFKYSTFFLCLSFIGE